MTDKNINLCDTEAEKQRYVFNMLPTYLLMKSAPEGKCLLRKMTKDLPKKDYKKKIHFAHIFNELATTQTYPHIGMRDIKTEDSELSNHPYESLLRALSAETAVELLEHAKIIDSCINKKLNNQLIIDFKTYLSEGFGYKDSKLNISMPAEDFYQYLVFSFIAHLDACIHHAAYSEIIAPISLGCLFMKKLDPDKCEYDPKGKKYRLTNKNGRPFTCTSRSLIEFLQTVFYWQIHKKMPISLYGIDKKITQKEFERPNIQSDSFMRRKKEGKWISLKDFFWLVGMEDSPKDESNEVLVNLQKSFIKYVKTENINELGGLPPSAGSVIWFIYAFFQNIYEQTDKHNKVNREEGCVVYDEYYDLWEPMTDYYESKISADIKDKRIEWPDYLKRQATPNERMA